MVVSEDRFFSTEEVAERLQVDEQTVRRWIKTGKLEAFKPGRAWRISPAALEALLESHSSPKVEPPRERPAGPDAGGSSFGEPGVLAERRLLSSLNPFASQVEARRRYWWELVDGGRVDLRTLEYATSELEFTSQTFKVLVDAAIAEQWSAAELGLLRRVYESVAGPYRQAWNALMEAGTKGFTSNMQGERRLRLVADEAMRELEKAEEAVRTAA